MTSSERPRCITKSHSLAELQTPGKWLRARRTPLATASSLPRSRVKSVKMRSASPSCRPRNTTPRVL